MKKNFNCAPRYRSYEEKTRICRVPEGQFDLLGYTFGRMYSGRTCACRELNPGILVMHSAQDWATKKVCAAHDHLGATGA
jgi:hypothetical protein